MLILNSSNAADDARAFEAAALAVMTCSIRPRGRKAEGTPVKRWRSRWFCQPIRPRRIWVLRRASTISRRIFGTRHSNPRHGAQTVAGVAMVADNPTDHHIFLKAFSGVQDLHSSSIGVKARTGNGDIEIMEQVAFRDQFGIRLTWTARDDAQRAALRGRGHGTSRSIASAEWRCLAAPYRAARSAAGCRPWRNPDIRDR